MTDPLKRYTADEFMVGLAPDLPNRNAPFFVTGRNIEFYAGAVQPITAQVQLFTSGLNTIITGLHTQQIDQVPTVVYGTHDKLGRWTASGGAAIEGTGYSGSEAGYSPDYLPTRWSFVAFGNWIVATNGQDAMQINKASSFVALGGTAPSTAEVVRRRGPFLVAFNTDRGGNFIEWCDRDDVEDWVSTPGNFAGELPVRDIDSSIIAAIEYRGELFFFSNNAMYVLQYLTSGNVFGQEKLLDNVGAVSKNAVVEAKGELFGFGPRGIWRSNGARFDFIAPPLVHKEVYDDFNYDKQGQVVGYYNPRTDSITWYYPRENSSCPCSGVTYCLRNRNWALVDYGRTAAITAASLQDALFGAEGGYIYVEDVSQTSAGPGAAGTLTLDDSPEATLGYGEGGYGEGGYGGSVIG